MFSFLNPALLLAAAAALIPLIIHLLSRRRMKVVEFSSLRHLKAMQRRQVRRLKIRQLLLLLLRMLLVFVLVAAFARPTSQSGIVGSHAAANAAIIFDNSASMNRFVPNGELFELARRRTDALISSLSGDDRVAVIPLIADGKAGALVTPALARQQLAAITPTDGSASLRTALAQATTLLRQSPSLNREIYLVTDRQRSLLPDTLVADSNVIAGIRTILVDLPIDAGNNVGIRSVSLGGQLLSVGVPFSVTGQLVNSGAAEVKDLIVSLFIDDRRVAQSALTIPAGEERPVVFTTSVPAPGRHTGYLELSADQFPADNRSYFGIRLPELVSVLVVGDDPGGRLVRLALQPTPDASTYWSVKQADRTALLSLPLDEYQVIVLAGAPALDATTTERLRRFLSAGKSLLVLLGEGTDAGSFNSGYRAITGLRLDSPMPPVVTRAGYFLLRSVAAEHPIFSLFDAKRLPEIKSFTLPKLSWQGQPGKTLMTFSGDRLAMGEFPIGRGKVITLGVPLDPALSEFATTALFVPFMARTVEYLAADVSAYETDLRVGTSLRRVLPAGVTTGARLEVIRPDSSRSDAGAEYHDGSLSLSLSDSRRAGIWKIQADGRTVDLIPLNLDPGESDLRAMPAEQFGAGIGMAHAVLLPASGEIAPLLATLRFGRELWPFLLWCALALIALELWLSRAAPEDESAT